MIETYREGGKVRQRTIAYLGLIPKELATTFAKALEGKAEGLGTISWKGYAPWTKMDTFLKCRGYTSPQKEDRR